MTACSRHRRDLRGAFRDTRGGGSGRHDGAALAPPPEVHPIACRRHRGDGVFSVAGLEPGPCLHGRGGLGRGIGRRCRHWPPGEVELHTPPLDPTQPVEDSAPWPQAPGAICWSPPKKRSRQCVPLRRVFCWPPRRRLPHGSPGLHDLAVSAGVGVLNTWGAKGVFHWRSRHHLATIGLQADDFMLSGLNRADLIIAAGLDPGESPEERWRLAPALIVPPAGLASLAERCGPRRHTSLTMPPLRSRLADVTQRGWGVEVPPLPPSRVTMHYAECVAAGALVAADAGGAGFWVARTLGTTRLGAVIVPPTSAPGFAAACVAVFLLRQPSRPALAVIDFADVEERHRSCRRRRRWGLACRSRRGTPTGTASTPTLTGSGCVGWCWAESRQETRPAPWPPTRVSCPR